MDLRSNHKVDTAFSIAAMTDMIFTLLLFFMLSTSYVTPSGLPVSLPSSVSSKIVMPRMAVTVTRDLHYYINDRRTTLARLPDELRTSLKGTEGVVVLHIDQSVPTEYLIQVAGIASSLKAKVYIATKPEE